MVKSLLNPIPEYAREIISIVNSSPYPSHMSMRLKSLELDRATVELEIGNCHLQPYGIVHGGVLSTLIEATHPEVSKHSKYLTQFCFDDVFQGSVAALFVRDELLVKRVAVFANPTNPYSARLAAEFRQKFVATGGQITEMVKISDEVGDLSAILQELRAQNSQLIYMPVQAECVTKVVKAARKIGWHPKMMGSDGLLATVMTKHRDKLELLDGLMATDFFSQETAATLYKKRLRKVYYSLYRHSPTSYSALGAEAYAVLYDTMNRCLEPDKRQEIQAELRQTTEFLGVAGHISITTEGKTERPLFINVIKGERMEPIVKAY